MIISKSGKKYVTSQDIEKLIVNCQITKKLERIRSISEKTKLKSSIGEETIKRTFFKRYPDAQADREILDGLGFTKGERAEAFNLLKEALEETDTRYRDLITPDRYAGGKEYNDLLKHYMQLRCKCWQEAAFLLNWQAAYELEPVYSWL